MKKIISLLISFILLSVLPSEVRGIEESEDSKLVRLPIVMYHQLTNKQGLLGKFTVSVDQFEEDLKYLKSEGYESVSISSLMAWNEGRGILPEKPFMITFDDGFESISVYALPLLEKYGFCAVLAVIGSSADLFTEKPDHMLDYSYLSWDAIGELSRSDVFEIQYHTYDMHNMGLRKGCMKKSGECFETYKEAIHADVEMFRNRCGEYGVDTTSTLAFPYGAYCEDTIAIYEGLGYKCAFTCREKVNLLSGGGIGMLKLNRYNRAHGKSSEQFFGLWR